MSDQTITSLIEKLEGAEVGSRELDCAICDALIPPDMRPRVVGHGQYDADAHVRTQSVNAGPSRSLDAALALAERVLGEEAALDQLFAVLGTERGGVKRIPLALCAAILRAQSEARV